MPYKSYDMIDIYNIIKRWHGNYKITQISRTLGIDRKTIRNYIQLAEKVGLSKEKPLPEKAELFKLINSLIPCNQKSQPARNEFEQYKQDIFGLINQKPDPLKPKTAYEVICIRHKIESSYSTFKRFIIDNVQELSRTATTCRFETPPGQEIQIDYCKVGRLFDPIRGKNRDVYAFIGILSSSRLKFVEFVYRQDQRSFVASHVRMFIFFDGVPQCLVIDNLKNGVIKPDLYDPKLNLSYQEMADHYGCFIDTARVVHPKDKPKVERSVQIVREMFRKYKALYPDLDISKANRLACKWCLEDNGMKEHGTTGLKPFEAYQEIKKQALKHLPIQHFEIPTWKKAKVHVDQFIQFDKAFYSVPEDYVGKAVWVRGIEKMIQIFYEYQLIKQYPRNHLKRQYDPKDFPKNFQLIMGEQAIQNLIMRAESVGSQFANLIRNVLTPHAKINYRRALGLLNFKEKYPTEILEAAAKEAISYQIYVPKQFKRLIEKVQKPEDENIPISHETQNMLRNPEYFIHGKE